MARVELDDVSFRYPIYDLAGRSLKWALMRQLSGSGVSRGGPVEVQALQNVSFTLEPGDRLGLIGRNGSGKSTLLRLMAGLAHPQSGRIQIDGRIIPLIEKGLGINPELSGHDNIELPLRLLGASSAEIRAARLEIPEFTGLGNFMHLPVRTYSEGIKTRLAFALCTAIVGDVLVLDEWLGAGDADFYNRAEERLNELLQKTRIVVLASHSNDLIRQVCNKAAWLDRGRLVMIGSTQDVLQAYAASIHRPVRVAVDTAA